METEQEDTLVINPHRHDDDEAKTREYIRPHFPRPVEWVEHSRRARSDRRRQSSKHTITKTVPALRYMVGMPVVPAFAGAPPAASLPASEPRIEQRRRTKAPPPSRGLRAVLTLFAIATTALALALFALDTSPAAAPVDGSVVVTAYAVSGAPKTGFKVIADGEARCTELPCRIELAPGEHYLAVIAAGYERTTTRRVNVAPGTESNVHFELSPRVD